MNNRVVRQLISIKPRLFTILAVLCVVFGAVAFYIYNTQNATPAQAGWYDENWYYRKVLEVSNTSGSVLTDFQIQILTNADLSSEISAGKIRSDLGDLRFFDANNQELKYWIEDSTSSSVDIWIKQETVPLGTSKIYMYYGNPTATGSSNGENVFEFFDDFSEGFESGKWTGSTANFSIGDGVLTGSNTNYRIQSNISFTGDYEVITRVYTTTYAANGFEVAGFWSATTNGYGVLNHNGNWYTRNDSTWLAQGAFAAINQWARVRAKVAGTSASASMIGETSGSDSATATNSGISNEYVSLGQRYDNGTYGQTYDADWDWIFVRKAVSTEPTVSSIGSVSEEQGPGPVGYWSFDDGTGSTASDMTVNNNDGTITGATWKSESECVSGKCLYFDGTNDFVSITHSNSLNIASEMSFSAWIKPNTLNAYQTIYGKINGSIDGISVRLENTGSTFGTYGSSENGEIVADATMTTGEWQHIAVVIDESSGKISFFYNGQLVNSEDFNTISWTHSQNAAIGKRNDASEQYFDGYIDEVKIYNYVRTADQIKQDYNKGQAVYFGSNINDTSLTDRLVGYWKFDEASANTCTGGVNDSCDSSGQVNDGAWTGGATATSTAKFGKALGLDGSGDYVNVGTGSDLDITAGNFTVCAWFKTSGSEEDIVANGVSANGRYLLMSYQTKLRGHVWYSGNANTIDSNSVVNDGEWHHGCQTVDEENISLYIDGKLDKYQALVGALTSASGTTIIGSRSAATDAYNFVGEIDEVRLYKRALSPEEVRRLYEYAPGPVGWWKFDENTGTSNFYDSSGNGHTGTMASMEESDWIANGKYGSALDFNAGGEYASVGTVDIGETWTISGWSMFPLESSAVSYNTMVRYGGSLHHVLVQSTTGLLGTYDLAFYSSGFDVRTLAPGWHYITAIGSGASTTFYVDGILRGTAASKMNEAVTTVGNTSGGTQQWGGLDELKIYNYARTQKQILEDMMAGRPNIPMVSYSFDEMQGTTAYDSGYLASEFDDGNNGTLTNMSTSGTSTAWTVNGKKGGALKFDGVNDTLSSTIDLSTTDAATLSFWFKFNDDSGSVKLLSEYSTNYNSNNSFLIAHSDLGIDGSLQLNDHTTSGYNIVYTSQAYNDNQWHHFVGIIDRSKGISQNKIYIDGELDTVQHATYKVDLSGNFGGSYPLYFGSRAGTNYFYNGLLDEAKIYNYALSIDEIRQEYNTGAQAVLSKSRENVQQAENGLIGWWKMDEESWSGNTGEVIDYSGLGNHGTRVGDATPTSTAKFGRAGEFDGTGDRVLIGDVYDAVDMKTIQFWAKFDVLTGSQEVVSKAISWNGVEVLLYLNNLSYYVMGGSGISSYLEVPTSKLNTTDWFFVTATQDGPNSQMKLYLNGELQSQTTAPPTITDATNLMIGDRSAVDRPFNGLVDEVKIYNYARNSEQIMADYTQGPPPIGHWKLDDMEGTSAVDSSGQGYTGTLSGATWIPKGYIGSGLSLDGNDYVDFGVLGDLKNNFSFSLWLNPDSGNGSSFPLAYQSGGDATSLQFRLEYGNVSTEIVEFGMYIDGAVTELATTQRITPGVWHHLVGTYDGTTMKIYIDGSLNNSKAQTGIPVYSSSRLVTGARYTGSYGGYWKGKIDNLKVYNYALSARQVAMEYNGGGPIAWYKMDEGEGGTAYDYSGNGNDGTITIGGSGTQTDISDAWSNGVSGKLNGSLNFDGTDDWVLGGSNLGISGDAEFTMTAWIKWSGTWSSNYPSAMGINRSVVNTGLSMTFRDGRPALDFWSNRYRATKALETNTWYHIAMTKTPGIIGSTSKIYVNGVEVAGAVENSNVSPAIVDSPPVVGRLDATRWFSGQVDEAKFFNYALTPDEIRKEYNGGFVNYFQ